MSKVWQVESSASRTKLTTKLKISTNLERLKISEFFVLYLSSRRRRHQRPSATSRHLSSSIYPRYQEILVRALNSQSHQNDDRNPAQAFNPT